MQYKAHLATELKDSANPLIRSAKVPVCTGRKWTAQAEVDHAISTLQHQEVMGVVQISCSGLGWGAPQQFWSKTTTKQQKTMVVDEVTRLERERFHIKAISQGNPGAWTQSDATMNRRLSWADIWRAPQNRLSLLLRAAYDTLPCPWNLTQWFGSEVGCPLCGISKASLQHISLGCKEPLTQKRRWHHDQVLSKLAEDLERCRVTANCSPE